MQLLAAGGVLAGNQLARWFAVAVLGLNAIDQMFFLPAYPFWSLTIIAMDIVALWGLCAYGSRENPGRLDHDAQAASGDAIRTARPPLSTAARTDGPPARPRKSENQAIAHGARHE